MKIAIIGSGNVGSALAKGFLRNGHSIVLGTRNQESFKGKSLLAEPGISVASIADASRVSEVIVIAAVPVAVNDIARELGDVSEKVIIDTMNSFRTKLEGFSNTTEALEKLTNCKNIVKCFNTTGAENMSNPAYPSGAIDMFYAGTSEKAKRTAKQLALEIGFGEAYDLGGSEKFNLLEQFASIWVTLAVQPGNNRGIAFRIVKR